MVEAHTNLTTMFLQFMLICSVSNTLYVAVASPCLLDEYRAGLECCPACRPGMHVERDCTEISITKCTDCTEGTFKEGLNGQKQCSTCTKCDTGLGLKVKKSCTSTSDALCEPMDGYFCTDYSRRGCKAAQRHTVCSPGRYISQTGTADKDTECLRCTYGTFSDGTSSCQHHTICESVGLKEIKPGTDSTDSECGADPVLVAGIISGIILLMALIIIIIIAFIQRKKRRELENRRLEMENKERLLQKQRTASAHLILEKRDLELKKQKTGLAHQIRDMKKETAEKKRELTAWAHLILEEETAEKKRKLTALAHQILETEAAEKKTKLTAPFRKYPPKRTPAIEEESVLPSSSLLSTEHPAGHPTSRTTSSTPASSSETQPAGQATSSTPATSSETQPATETTPLMSSDSPEPTSDLQEPTITIHAVTIDDHDDDQSLDPLTGHPEV